MSGSHLSKDFFELVKSIGESRSKQEEDKIISHEVRVLKAKMGAKNVASKKMKEYLIRMLYVEMLGHDASFGHIHAVKMVHSNRLMEKRVGYLIVSLVLHADHSFMLLLVNSLQSDLKSDNFLEVSMALSVVCRLINVETIPAVLPLVIPLLDHKQANIRKKAVMALHRFFQIDPPTIANQSDKVRKVLCDKDPSVMGASLCLLHDLAAANPRAYKDLVPSFVSILKQVTEHRLPRDYDYHRMPAPWIQLKLLQVLALLGQGDKRVSEGMYEILHEVMKRADIGINVGYAIVYECVRTVTTIYPESSLIEDAAMSISRFITSENHNLKYLGVNSLASIVQMNPKYAAEHQMVVIDCLEDKDETLRRKTLDLLYSMTNPNNVVVIVDKLTTYLRNTTDVYLRTELVSRITQLAEKFSPNNGWFIDTMNDVFELGGKLVKPEVAHNVMKLVAESVDEEDEEDMRVYAVETYIDMLTEKPILPDVMLQVIAWVLGEYGHMSTTQTREQIMELLLALIDKQHDDPFTRSWGLSALMKLIAHADSIPPKVLTIVAKFQNSLFVDLQQRAHEFLELAKGIDTMRKVLPLDASSQEVLVDDSLSFLDGYVKIALDNGAKPLSRPTLDLNENTPDPYGTTGAADSLNFTPYAAHVSNTQVSATEFEASNSNLGGMGNIGNAGAGRPVPKDPSQLNLANASNRWGPKATPAPEPEAENPHLPTSAPQVSQQQETRDWSKPRTIERKPKKEVPRELTEKEKMAQALFGGGVAVAKSRKKINRTRKPIAKTQPARPAAQPVVQPAIQPAQPVPAAKPVQELDLLFGGDFAAGASEPVAASSRPAPAQSAGGDLLDLLGDAFATSSPTPHQQQSSAAGGLDLMGAMSGLSVQPTAQPAAQPAQPAAFQVQGSLGGGGTKDMSDPFAMLGGGGGGGGGMGDLDMFGGAVQQQQQGVFGLEGASPSMKQRLSGLDSQGSKEVVVGADQSFHIVSLKYYMGDRTVLALFVTNKRNTPMQNVVIQLSSVTGLNLTYDGEPTPQVKTMQTPPGTSLTLASIAAGSTSTQLIGIQVTDASAFAGSMSIEGQVSFSGAMGRLPFRTALHFRDLVRPAQMNTQQYGGYWKQFPCEMKVTVMPTACNTTSDFMGRMQHKVNIFPVQTIGQETIVAGKAVSGGNLNPNLLCFVHGKIRQGACDVIVRTKHPAFSKALANECMQELK